MEIETEEQEIITAHTIAVLIINEITDIHELLAPYTIQKSRDPPATLE